MTQRCCVEDCKHSRRTSSCTFKRFPTDPQKSKLWESLVRRSAGLSSGAPEWQRAAWDRICECHFDDEQFEKNRQDGLRRLRWDAVPSLFGDAVQAPRDVPLKSNNLSASQSKSDANNTDFSEHSQGSSHKMNVEEGLAADLKAEGESEEIECSNLRLEDDERLSNTECIQEDDQQDMIDEQYEAADAEETIENEQISNMRGTEDSIEGDDTVSLAEETENEPVSNIADTEDAVEQDDAVSHAEETAVSETIPIVADTGNCVSGNTDCSEIGGLSSVEGTSDSADVTGISLKDDTEESVVDDVPAPNAHDESESHSSTEASLEIMVPVDSESNSNSSDLEITASAAISEATAQKRKQPEPADIDLENADNMNEADDVEGGRLPSDQEDANEEQNASDEVMKPDTAITEDHLSSDEDNDPSQSIENEKPSLEDIDSVQLRDMTEDESVDQEDGDSTVVNECEVEDEDNGELEGNVNAEAEEEVLAGQEEILAGQEEVLAGQEDVDGEGEEAVPVSQEDVDGEGEEAVPVSQEDVDGECEEEVPASQEDDDGEGEEEVSGGQEDGDGEDINDFDGDGEGDMEGEGEEYGAEEEEFEDGEEMAEEVEVEIEDYSDPEMEPEDGVTYIISVEENEGSESFQTSEDGIPTEDEHNAGDDQSGNLPKTKRIVIKVPSSKSLSDVENDSKVIQVSKQETVFIKKDRPAVESAGSSCKIEDVAAPVLQREPETVTTDAISNDTSPDVASAPYVVGDVDLPHLKDDCESEVQVAEEKSESLSKSENSDEDKEGIIVGNPSNDGKSDKTEADNENADHCEDSISSVTLTSATDQSETPENNTLQVNSKSLEQLSDKSIEVSEISAQDIVNEPEQPIVKIAEVAKTAPVEKAPKQKEKPTKPAEKSSDHQRSEIPQRSQSSASQSVKRDATSKQTLENKDVSTVAGKIIPKSSEKMNKDDKSAKASSKSGSTALHKHKKQLSKSHSVDKLPNSAKTVKSDPVKDDRAPKSESHRKILESKEVSSRSSHNDSHQTTKKVTSSKEAVASSHRTRSNSVTAKDSSHRDRRASTSRKEESTSKKATIATIDDPPSSGKTNSDAKSSLRSSRSRKNTADVSGGSANVQEPPAKKDKTKQGTETAIRPRQSERVSKATEKAIASGLVPRRSRSNPVENNSNVTKLPDSDRDEGSGSHKRGKRKAESPPRKEDNNLNKRRTTRSSEINPSNDTAPSTTQSLRSVRKSKALKRKSSSNDVPPAKQAHTIKKSPGASEELIASIPKMCRICGSKNDNLLNVFGPEGCTMKLAEKINNLLSIKIHEDEPLPSGVCHSCVVTLIACEKLVEKSSNIDKKLRTQFNCPVEEQEQDLDAQEKEAPSTSSKKEKSTVESAPAVQSVSTAHLSVSKVLERSTSEPKPVSVTRSSSRVSGKLKQAANSSKQPDNKQSDSKQTDSSQPGAKVTDPLEDSQTGANIIINSEAEDAPPVLEAEPPQSHLPTSNQEPSAQPPVLMPQPDKPLPELVRIPAEDPSNAMKRFGNTYRARMKQGQWEKIERGLEAIHGELADSEQEEESQDIKPFRAVQTEEFHIVDLDMNVEEVPPEASSVMSKGQPPTEVRTELQVEILPETTSEENAVQSSSPKSVIDSILVDWSGDEEDVGPVPRGNAAGTDQPAAGGKDNFNGSSQLKQSTAVSKTPCLFGDDEDGDNATRAKLKPAIMPVVVKQESFWPDPSPGMSTTPAAEKHPNDVPWKCFVCGKRGKSVPKFLEHKKLHLNDRKLVSCPKCSESFSNVGLLKSHMKSHHGDDDEEDMALERQIRQNRRRVLTLERPEDTVVDIDLTPANDGLYHCSLCLSAFTNIESLCQHKLIHQQNEDSAVFKCALCRRTFFQIKDYQDHLATHRPGAPNLGVFQCAKCDVRVSSQREFIDHIKTHSPQEHSFKCDMCNKMFDTKHKLRSHRSTVHKSTAYACHLCDKVCQKRITLVEHLRKHTGDNPFACPVCNKRFNRLANYKAHMTIHENARRYECPYCGKRFNRQSIQQRHIKTHTNEQSRKHRCRVCNLTFGLATEMFTHRKLHTREEVERANWEDEKQRMALTSFPCKVCQTPFNTVEEVLAHMPHHTNDERDVAVKLKNPRLECDICGKVLNSKRTFNAHRSSHIDGKPFVCKICSKGYSTSTGLNYHMLSHTGERPFPCTFCNKGYKNSTDLKVHMRQHTGEFPYKCNLCNKAFRSASSLQKHGFVHSEERPFKCQYCNMSFKREGTKLNHERIHTNDRRFKCKVCSRSFIQKGACDAHEKLHFRSGLYASIDGSLITSASMMAVGSSQAKMSGTEKHDLFDDIEEEDFDEDDDDEDEYIIYEDDSVEDGDEEEMDVAAESSHKGEVDPLKPKASSEEKDSFEEPPKSSNGVDLPATSVPVPVTVSGDAVPSVGDSSVHITIL